MGSGSPTPEALAHKELTHTLLLAARPRPWQPGTKSKNPVGLSPANADWFCELCVGFRQMMHLPGAHKLLLGFVVSCPSLVNMSGPHKALAWPMPKPQGHGFPAQASQSPQTLLSSQRKHVWPLYLLQGSSILEPLKHTKTASLLPRHVQLQTWTRCAGRSIQFLHQYTAKPQAAAGCGAGWPGHDAGKGSAHHAIHVT